MTQIDWSTLINWIVSAFIAFLFGAVGAWIAYRLDRKRDDLSWERERKRFQEEWQREKKLQEAEFHQRFKELEIKFLREDRDKLQNLLLAGSEDPVNSVESLVRTRTLLRKEILVQSQRLTEYGEAGSLSMHPELLFVLLSNDTLTEEQIAQLETFAGRELSSAVLEKLREGLQEAIDTELELQFLNNRERAVPELLESKSQSLLADNNNS